MFTMAFLEWRHAAWITAWSYFIHYTIDDLSLICNILMYVYNTTLSEIIGSNSSVSDMQSLLDQLLSLSDKNNIQINFIKTKEIILGSASKKDLPSLTIHGSPLERVSVYKLLGIFISADLHWEMHIEYIIPKAVMVMFFKTVEKSWFIIRALTALLYHSDQTSTRICLTALIPYLDQVSN